MLCFCVPLRPEPALRDLYSSVAALFTTNRQTRPQHYLSKVSLSFVILILLTSLSNILVHMARLQLEISTWNGYCLMTIAPAKHHKKMMQPTVFLLEWNCCENIDSERGGTRPVGSTVLLPASASSFLITLASLSFLTCLLPVPCIAWVWAVEAALSSVAQGMISK